MNDAITIKQDSRPGEILRQIIREQGMTQQKIADLIHTDRRNVNQSLLRPEDMRLKTFISIANATGYEVILKKSEN